MSFTVMSFRTVLAAAVLLGSGIRIADAQEDPPPGNEIVAPGPEDAPGPIEMPEGEEPEGVAPGGMEGPPMDPGPGGGFPGAPVFPPPPEPQPEQVPVVVVGEGPGAVKAPATFIPAVPEELPPLVENPELTMKFRNVPLDTVLDYLSRAAGYVIIREVQIDERVDAWSHHPLNREEAVALLNTILNDRGYAIIAGGPENRVLRIVSKDVARSRNIPVRRGADPEEIPATDVMVTQIIPIRHAEAPSLVENLKPLLAPSAVMSADRSSNTILLTDTQANIRRMVEIIQALDTSIANILQLKVIPLQYADAEEVAEVVTKVFQIPSTASSQNSRSRGGGRMDFFMRMGGGGPPGFGGGDQGAGGPSDARMQSSHVSAAAEKRSNSLVVTAPEDVIPEIEELVRAVDVSTEALTTIEVFMLEFADAEQTATILTNLFAQDSSSSGSDRSRRFPFGGPFGNPFDRGRGGNGSSSSGQSQRQLEEAKVTAVADTRTNTLIVTASEATMVEIRAIIKKLDADPAKKKKVYVYQLDNADAEGMVEILQGMFEDTGRSTSGSSNNTQSIRNAPSFFGNTGAGTSGQTGQRTGGSSR